MFDKKKILRDLRTKRIGSKVYVFESIDSTNACARTLAEAGADDGTIVVSDFQTEGKGRLGRQWLANPGTSLLFSTILRPTVSSASAGLLSFFAAVSVARALEKEVKMPVECKWPNDLLLNERKVSGILLENSVDRQELSYSVAGIGINVTQKSFDASLQQKATSIARETGKAPDRISLLRSILREMDVLYGDIQANQFETILKEWNARCTMFGKNVTILLQDQPVQGSAVGLSREGGLILDTPQGEKTVFAGDVTILKD